MENKKDILNEAYLRANSVDAVRGLAYRNGHIREAEELARARTMILKLIDYIEKKEEQMEVAYGQSIKSCADLEKDQKHEALNIKEDPVNPDHYKNQTSLECIEAMEIVFGRGAVIDFCRCNAWKYIWRWKNKNGTEDLEKANWYLERAYEMLDGSDTRMTTVMRMIHYVNKNSGEKGESDG